MSASHIVVVLIVGLIISGIAGPLVLRRSAPALMRAPRTAVALIVGGSLAWAGALVTTGLVMAWAASGPAVLGGTAGEICQRCLAAASPFSTSITGAPIPAVVPLVFAGIVAAVVVGGVMVEGVQRRNASRAVAASVQGQWQQRVLDGRPVKVVHDSRPFAWTLTARWGGVMISSGALDVLSKREVAAVVAHEYAHLRQRHHTAASLMDGLRRTLGWVPAIRAAAGALPHYLEIAADIQAQKHAGTRALAGALLVLGSHGSPVAVDRTPVLHMSGPHRIGRLTQRTPARGGSFSASIVGAVAVAYAALAIAVIAPYGAAIASGCTI